MLTFFKNKLYASLLFFLVLAIDIYIKLSDYQLPLRYVTKSLVIIILFLIFNYNKKEKDSSNKYFVLGLLSFWIGDIFLLMYETPLFFKLGIVFFIIGKLMYTKRFSHQNDFNIGRLLPFFVVLFTYMVIVTLYVYDNLGDFFLPTLAYLFSAMLMALFAYLRKDSVNKMSFYLVLVAMFFKVVSDTIGVLHSFYNPDIAYHKITIMLFYGLFQYFVVLGLIKEEKYTRNIKEDNFTKL
ncbi:lysoplasmalogenase [Olleya aquimaris]|uniref:YhhN-like protein n=1 Tax=Olleya aquimaris TaxID=639310 RepID=A0A327RL53_9FLAO|nr:lysoplasmalogenase [Olleya aquimaris]RAJ16898.1 YhhN-like protein [Olleya aquimaris]